MRKTRKILLVFVLALVFTSLFAVPAFAVTEDEVQQQVNAIGREGVTGNIFTRLKQTTRTQNSGIDLTFKYY